MDEIDPPVSLELSSNQDSKDFILSQTRLYVDASHYTEEFYDHLERLWADRGVQDCHERSNEYQARLHAFWKINFHEVFFCVKPGKSLSIVPSTFWIRLPLSVSLTTSPLIKTYCAVVSSPRAFSRQSSPSKRSTFTCLTLAASAMKGGSGFSVSTMSPL